MTNARTAIGNGVEVELLVVVVEVVVSVVAVDSDCTFVSSVGVESSSDSGCNDSGISLWVAHDPNIKIETISSVMNNNLKLRSFPNTIKYYTTLW